MADRRTGTTTEVGPDLTVREVLMKKRLYRFTPEGQNELNLLLGPIREEILVQGQLVRNLKEKKAEGDLTNEVSKLKKLRRTLEKTEAELTAEEDEIDYKKISSTIKNHFFYSQSATLYGGSGGFIDFGPYGIKVGALCSIRRPTFWVPPTPSSKDPWKTPES